eukprot:g2669.t1
MFAMSCLHMSAAFFFCESESVGYSSSTSISRKASTDLLTLEFEECCADTDDANRTIASARKELQSRREEGAEKFAATLVLGSVGDALGHKDRKWEFNKSGRAIREELRQITGGKNASALVLKKCDFPLSDDSMLHGATAKALLAFVRGNVPAGNLVRVLAEEFVLARTTDPNRCYGPGTMAILRKVAASLNENSPIEKAFDPRGGGCGGSMRSACIGLCFPILATTSDIKQLKQSTAVRRLVAVAVDAGRITHRHPTGYLGTVTGAFFTALALKGEHTFAVVEWGRLLLDVAIPLALDHVRTQGVDVAENIKAAEYFISFSGWGGASGHDAPMIAYDAMLCGGSRVWNITVEHAMLHGGDSDSTGILAGSWYGALNGFGGVPESHSHAVEYGAVLMRLGFSLFDATLLSSRRPDRTERTASAHEFEQHLQKLSKSKASPMVQTLLSQLQEAVVYTDSGNVATNRKLWDNYAREWSPNTEWVQQMAGNLSSGGPQLIHVGDEWSDAASLDQVVTEYVKPYIDAGCVAAEIGSGGGRVASRVCGLDTPPASLHCFDISKEMLKRAHSTLSDPSVHRQTRVSYCLLKEGGEGLDADKWSKKFDFVYSFDVFVHMDLHTMWKYFRSIRRMLRPGSGRAFVSTANLAAPAGWARFAKQTKYTVGGFYFVTPDLIRLLIQKSGLRILKESKPDDKNIYYNRDYLVVLGVRD